MPDDIGPSAVSFYKEISWNKEHMRKLCYSYMGTLSYVCVTCARYYSNDGGVDHGWVEHCLDAVLAVVDKLDYTCLSNEEKRSWLFDFGDSGEYTFVDTYNNTETRLYEMLIRYATDNLWEKRNKVYNYIVSSFNGALDTTTGGWLSQEYMKGNY